MLLGWGKRYDHRFWLPYREVPDIPTARSVDNTCKSVHGLDVSNNLHTLFICDITFYQPGMYTVEVVIVPQNGLAPSGNCSLIENLKCPSRPFRFLCTRQGY